MPFTIEQHNKCADDLYKVSDLICIMDAWNSFGASSTISNNLWRADDSATMTRMAMDSIWAQEGRPGENDVRGEFYLERFKAKTRDDHSYHPKDYGPAWGAYRIFRAYLSGRRKGLPRELMDDFVARVDEADEVLSYWHREICNTYGNFKIRYRHRRTGEISYEKSNVKKHIDKALKSIRTVKRYLETAKIIDETVWIKAQPEIKKILEFHRQRDEEMKRQHEATEQS